MILDCFSGDNPSKSINPAEAVAYGAAIQAATFQADTLQAGTLSIAEGPVKAAIRIIDVYTLSLGIETVGEIFAILIPRNTVIPTRKSEM